MGFLDRFYAGVRCRDNNDCVSQSCVEGFCRCTTDLECGNDWARDEADPLRWQDFQSGIVCADPIAGTPGAGMVCRATHPAQWLDASKVGEHFTGVKVYRDKLDRWASSRPLWNQHVYTITNVNDDGTIPATANWTPNYTVPELNNFRQNRQGSTSADLADITGALDSDNVCQFTSQGGTTFTGRICNRGLRGVGANMPASFYLGDVANGAIVCQTQTNGPVPVGGCSDIQCTANSGEVPPNTTITMVVNDAGLGARITDECNYDNNTSQVSIQACRPPR